MAHTHKSLQKDFNLSPEAVISTLQGCGIDSSQSKFSDSEIAGFAKARQALTSGAIKDYSDIPQYLADSALELNSETAFDSLVEDIAKPTARNLGESIAECTMSELANMYRNGEMAEAVRQAAQRRGLFKPFDREEFLARMEAKRRLTISPTPSAVAQSSNNTSSDTSNDASNTIEAQVVDVSDHQPI